MHCIISYILQLLAVIHTSPHWLNSARSAMQPRLIFTAIRQQAESTVAYHSCQLSAGAIFSPLTNITWGFVLPIEFLNNPSCCIYPGDFGLSKQCLSQLGLIYPAVWICRAELIDTVVQRVAHWAGDSGDKILWYVQSREFWTELAYGRILKPLLMDIDDNYRLALRAGHNYGRC